MRHGDLPAGLEVARTTADFDAGTVPAGLLRAHQIAPDVWGVLEVVAGTVEFVWEERPDASVDLAAGDTVVIPPQVPHHVVPGPDGCFRVSFHRRAV